MKLSRTVSYAVNAALQLARNESTSPIPCSRLASAGKMPERFLLQILRNLVTHGILNSTRGVDGGYRLARPAAEVSLLELIEAVEGPIEAEETTASKLPDDARRLLHEALQQVTATNRRQLEAIKLAHLLEPPGPPVREGSVS